MCVRSSDYATSPVKNNNISLLFVMLSVDDDEEVKEKAITGFRSWLTSQDKTKATIKNTVNYAKRFSHVLDTGDASSLLTLSQRNKHHAMSALANYAKYTGRYDQFLQIRHKYNLKWTKGGSLQYFERFFHNKELSFDMMLSKVKQMMKVLPPFMSQIVQFGVLTGLRSSEILQSVELINSGSKEILQEYYDVENMMLCHWKFKQFLRTTKIAYVSFVTPEMVDMGKGPTSMQPLTYNQIRSVCYSNGITCDMRFCRKLFATWLYRSGISEAMINMLQGRAPSSILHQHYIASADNSLRRDVLAAVEKMREKIMTVDD
jgi:intergrase/recombinase